MSEMTYVSSDDRLYLTTIPRGGGGGIGRGNNTHLRRQDSSSSPSRPLSGPVFNIRLTEATRTDYGGGLGLGEGEVDVDGDRLGGQERLKPDTP